LYETQRFETYDTWSDKYENADYFGIFFEPCSDENSSRKCSGKSKVFGALQNHNMRLRYKQTDDKDNIYWVQTPLPSVGQAMSIYIREVTTVDEDFHYLFGYAFLGLFGDNTETPGVTKRHVIGKVLNNHEPTSDRSNSRFSLSIYIR